VLGRCCFAGSCEDDGDGKLIGGLSCGEIGGVNVWQ